MPKSVWGKDECCSAAISLLFLANMFCLLLGEGREGRRWVGRVGCCSNLQFAAFE